MGEQLSIGIGPKTEERKKDTRYKNPMNKIHIKTILRFSVAVFLI